jgi:hypothetical protein
LAGRGSELSPAMLRCRPMPPPESGPPETRERRCPACQSERIAPVGHVKAAGGLIKSEQQCEACGTGFVFVRKAIL